MSSDDDHDWRDEARMSGDAHVVLIGRELQIETPFDREFVDALKAAIPGKDRRWDADTKLWLVHKMYRRQVVELLEAHFDHVEVEEQKLVPRPVPAPQDDSTRAYANLIRFVDDETLQSICDAAFHDRAAARDDAALAIMEDAHKQILAHRERTGKTG